MEATPITDAEFARYRTMLLRTTGISLSAAKKTLLTARLARRLQHCGLRSYGDYFEFIMEPEHADERQLALDLLTTNETYFFREPRHFDILKAQILPQRQRGRLWRVWSAACSSGEEPYSLAMLHADVVGGEGWEILASDISTRMLEKARAGHYPMTRGSHIPKDYLKRFCLKGIGPQQGTFLVEKPLREKVGFRQVNLNEPLPDLGLFDVIFLRNVMIYFDNDTKLAVVRRLLERLRPGGHLMVGHSETLNGIVDGLRSVMPAVYQKPA